MISVLKKKLSNNKGFTLAELLIVVGIIAILVAVAIPVFSGQLSKAKDSVMAANIRSARAQASVSYMMKDCKNGGETWKYEFTVDKNGKMTMKAGEKVENPNNPEPDTCTEDSSNSGYTGTVYISGTDYDGST